MSVDWSVSLFLVPAAVFWAGVAWWACRRLARREKPFLAGPPRWVTLTFEDGRRFTSPGWAPVLFRGRAVRFDEAPVGQVVEILGVTDEVLARGAVASVEPLDGRPWERRARA